LTRALEDGDAGVGFGDLGARWRTEEDMVGWVMVGEDLVRRIEKRCGGGNMMALVISASAEYAVLV